MGQNYLAGTIGNAANLLLSAAAFNLRKLLNELAFFSLF
jgi:hypothetical protein